MSRPIMSDLSFLLFTQADRTQSSLNEAVSTVHSIDHCGFNTSSDIEHQILILSFSTLKKDTKTLKDMTFLPPK